MFVWISVRRDCDSPFTSMAATSFVEQPICVVFKYVFVDIANVCIEVLFFCIIDILDLLHFVKKSALSKMLKPSNSMVAFGKPRQTLCSNNRRDMVVNELQLLLRTPCYIPMTSEIDQELFCRHLPYTTKTKTLHISFTSTLVPNTNLFNEP